MLKRIWKLIESMKEHLINRGNDIYVDSLFDVLPEAKKQYINSVLRNQKNALDSEEIRKLQYVFFMIKGIIQMLSRKYFYRKWKKKKKDKIIYN